MKSFDVKSVSQDMLSIMSLFRTYLVHLGLSLSASKFIGNYKRLPVETDWHEVELYTKNGELLIWKNKAGFEWNMSFDGQKLVKTDDYIFKSQVRKLNELARKTH